MAGGVSRTASGGRHRPIQQRRRRHDNHPAGGGIEDALGDAPAGPRARARPGGEQDDRGLAALRTLGDDRRGRADACRGKLEVGFDAGSSKPVDQGVNLGALALLEPTGMDEDDVSGPAARDLERRSERRQCLRAIRCYKDRLDTVTLEQGSAKVAPA